MQKVPEGDGVRQVPVLSGRSPAELPENVRQEMAKMVKHLLELTSIDKILLVGEAPYIWRVVLIVDTPSMAANIKYWRDAEKSLRAVGMTRSVDLEVFDIRKFNTLIRENEYRIVNMLVEAYLLHDGGTYSFSKPPRRMRTTRKAELERQFKYWHETAGDFYSSYQHLMAQGRYTIAIFHLHQAVERYATTVLVVFGATHRKHHDIEELLDHATTMAAELAIALPKEDADKRKLFKRLKESYVASRYVPHYQIQKPDLESLGATVEELGKIVEKVCRTQIATILESPPPPTPAPTECRAHV